MKVLVTGGTGFLGRHVVWRLAAAGMDVVFTGRDAARADQVAKRARKPVSFTYIEHGTPGASDAMKIAAVGCEAVVHCAALSSPWGPRKKFVWANVDSTREVLACCGTNNIHQLVHVSTPGLYFDYSDRLYIREDQPLPRPANDYVDTKREAENLVRATPCRRTTILRPRAIFGPWDTTLMPRLMRAIERGPLPLLRGGRAMIDLTHVDNAVEAVWLSLTRQTADGVATYNVSNGEPIAVAELLSEVASRFGLPLRMRRLPYPIVDFVARLAEWRARWSGVEPVLTRYTAGLLAFSQTLCLDAIRRDLGYSPIVRLREGLAAYATWMAAREHA